MPFRTLLAVLVVCGALPFIAAAQTASTNSAPATLPIDAPATTSVPGIDPSSLAPAPALTSPAGSTNTPPTANGLPSAQVVPDSNTNATTTPPPAAGSAEQLNQNINANTIDAASATNSQTSPATAGEQFTTVPADTPPKLPEGKKVPTDPSTSFMKRLAWEAISSSQDWRARWLAPDFGRLSIRIAHKRSLTMARGVVLPWRRDNQGFPEVILHVVLEFPVLKRVALTDLQRPVETVPVDIRQYVTFYPKRGRWWAASSPYYITMGRRGDSVELLSVREGKGAWSAWVGRGGLVVKDFIEGGLAAARSRIVRTFRDEEINWFLRGNSDVIFYLRPRIRAKATKMTGQKQEKVASSNSIP